MKLQIFLFLLLFSASSWAQGEMRIGVKLIPDIAWNRDNGLGDAQFAISGGLQVYKNIQVKFFGVESGLYLLQKKGERDLISAGTTKRVNIQASYLSLPLLIRINVWKLYASSGLNLNFKVKEETNGTPVNLKGAVVDYSLNFGFQHNFGKRFGLFGELRYNPVLTKVQEGDGLFFTNLGFGLGMNLRVSKSK